MTVYRIFDNSISCELSIPGLTEVEQESGDWQVILSKDTVIEEQIDWLHHWQLPTGEDVMSFARNDQTSFLRFIGLACFSIDLSSRRITILPENDCPPTSLAHLLIDQVIPRVLCHQGRVVLHASAIEMIDGHAVAFTGVSGQGKSTLASAFVNAGYGLLSDDCLLLEKRDGEVYAMSSYPSLRLWSDSTRAVAWEVHSKGIRFSEMAHYTNKTQVLFAAGDGSVSPRWVKLKRLYLLQPEPESGQTDSSAIQITPAGGMATIMALIESLFALDVVSADAVRQSFRMVQKVASGIKVRKLAYPRSYESLPEVISAVLHDIHT